MMHSCSVQKWFGEGLKDNWSINALFVDPCIGCDPRDQTMEMCTRGAQLSANNRSSLTSFRLVMGYIFVTGNFKIYSCETAVNG